MTVWGFIKGFGKLLLGGLLLLQGIVSLIVMLFVVGVVVSVSNGVSTANKDEPVTVPEKSALLINPNGALVELAEDVDPFEKVIQEAYGADEPADIEVHDLVRAVRKAATDDRITGIVLDLSQLSMTTTGSSKAHYFANALAAFKESGKPIISIADNYDQDQYLIAAQADEIYLHDKGSLVLIGYGSYGLYLKSFLEKIKVTTHVFRVGTFKAAVEPFLRDDMSPEAREANAAFLNVLWDQYGRSVEQARGLQPGSIARFADDYNAILRAAGGDVARAALEYGLVDGLKSRPEQLAVLKEKFGKSKDGKSFKNVSYTKYLSAIGKREKDGSDPNIAVITAAGAIVDGEAPLGAAAGGDTIAKDLKRALEDENVKAVVLRVDSPGGSAFASEIIRDGVIALKEAGKPVIVSMGSLAASGGYWISAPADEIWAAPTTITGSIGIFAFFPTFEKAAEHWGLSLDGVGTSKLSSFYGVGLGPLEPEVADIFQQGIEKGYDDFLTVVSDGRGLDKSYVNEVGQGRVWIGEKALELKLVDKLGDIDAAIASAAEKAGLEKYDVIEFQEELSPFNKFIAGLAAETMVRAGVSHADALSTRSTVGRFLASFEEQVRFFDEFNDPSAAYARCIACDF